MDKKEPMGFMAACRDYFGMLPGQTLTEFSAECKKLTEKDKAEISAGLIEVGYTLK